jgi:hypothetical protein
MTIESCQLPEAMRMEPSTLAAASSYGIPAELIEGTSLEAERDAERVFVFLSSFCEAFDELHPELEVRNKWKSMFPARFLLELAAALRIIEWEQDGLTTPAMQLPQGWDALYEVLLDMARTDGTATLSLMVGRVFADYFAWNARSHIGGSIALDDLDDDQLADRIASFLWEHRNDLEAQ